MVIELDSTNVSAYFKHAGLHYQLGDYDSCIREQNEIVNIAFVKGNMHEYKQAILNLDTAIALQPKYAKAFNRANAKEQLKRYPEAIEDYNKALELQPNYPEVYLTGVL